MAVLLSGIAIVIFPVPTRTWRMNVRMAYSMYYSQETVDTFSTMTGGGRSMVMIPIGGVVRMVVAFHVIGIIAILGCNFVFVPCTLSFGDSSSSIVVILFVVALQCTLVTLTVPNDTTINY